MNFSRTKIANDTDENLLALFVQTNQSGYFKELYYRYIPLIYGLFVKYLQDTEKAENATIRLFEILLPKVSGYEINVFRTWIYGVAKNHCLQILRKEENYISIDFVTSVTECDSVLHLLEKNESAALSHCIEKLPKPQKTCISMFFIEKHSYADIAEQTGFLLKTVKSHIQTGKKNLKNCIENHSGT